MRLFYQSFGVSRGSREGHYAQVLKNMGATSEQPSGCCASC